MVEGGCVLQSLEGLADFHGIVSYKVWKVWPIFMALEVDRAKLTKDRIVDAISMVGRIIT